ncbi:MAG: hypothetical protein LBL27_02410 [Coriobacteriales bacterium]|jgi:hypothetical protein|nr:hypothetical protein [Coriobacteriales bacterium]
MAMKHFFSKDNNGVCLTFNDVRKVGDSDSIPFYFEQMVMDDSEVFHYAEGMLPSVIPTRTYGFTPIELQFLEGYLTDNCEIIYELAYEYANGLRQ